MGIFDDRRHPARRTCNMPSHTRLEEALVPLAALVPEHASHPDENKLYPNCPLTAGDARRAAKLLEPTS